jgi:hypothetical protein
MVSQKVLGFCFPSFRRKPESSSCNELQNLWTPAFAGVTTFCEFIRITSSKSRAKRNAMNKSKNYQEKLNDQQKESSTAGKPVKGGAGKTSDKLNAVFDAPMTRPIDTSLTKPLPLESDQTLRRRFMVMDEPIAGNFRFGLLLEILGNRLLLFHHGGTLGHWGRRGQRQTAATGIH